jgi:hypothetical protein
LCIDKKSRMKICASYGILICRKRLPLNLSVK